MKKLFIFSLLVLSIGFAGCKEVKQIQDNLLRSSLHLLGDKFFGLIADGPQKQQMLANFDKFVERAISGETPPEQVEYVAANMLNATNSKDSISTELADAILDDTETSAEEELPKAVRERKSMNSGDLGTRHQTLAKTLNSLLHFNNSLANSYHQKHADKELRGKVFYRFDASGINMEMDESLRDLIDPEKPEDLDVAMQEVERLIAVKWDKDLEKNLKMESMKVMAEMKKLEGLKSFEHLKDFKGMENFIFIGEQDSNFINPYSTMPDVEAILKDVEQKLKEAGVHKIVVK